MKLNRANYFSAEANREYMSKSQFRRFTQCEAAALAELNGEYEPERSNALLVGSYIDAAMESPKALEKFIANTPEIMNSRTGELKADYKQAEQIVERIKADKLFSMLLHGRKQVILHGEIAGVKFRGCADCVLAEPACERIMKQFPETIDVLGGIFTEGCIVDLKTTKDFAPVWSDAEGRKVSWIEAWGYPMQGAIYQELYRQMHGKTLPFVIVAVSKEKVPEIGAFFVPQNELDVALQVVETFAPVYQKIKVGERGATRCEQCAYCRSTRKLTRIVNYKEEM